jgi:hypothetical protein
VSIRDGFRFGLGQGDEFVSGWAFHKIPYAKDCLSILEDLSDYGKSEIGKTDE